MLKCLIKGAVTAFAMYSKIPMPSIKWDDDCMRYALCFFPLAGAVLGAAEWLLGRFMLWRGVGSLVFGAVMTVLPIFYTGGIHMDGFLDTMDGICSYADKEKRLEILKDSNSGAFAVIGGLVYFTLSVAFWSAADTDALNIACIGFCLSRALSGLSVVVFPPAKNTGLAAAFRSGADKKAVCAAMILYTAVCLAAAACINLKGCCTLAAVSLACFAYHYHNCMHNFGGITGDLAGFFLQVTELCILIFSVII